MPSTSESKASRTARASAASGRLAQTLRGALATDDIKDIERRGADRLAREGRARGVDDQTGLDARLVRERAQRVLDCLGRPRLDLFETTGERGQKFLQA